MTSWTVARQAPLSMEFSGQESWRGLSCPSPGNLPNPEMEPRSLALQADSLPSEPGGKPCYPKNMQHNDISFLCVFVVQVFYHVQETSNGLERWGLTCPLIF